MLKNTFDSISQNRTAKIIIIIIVVIILIYYAYKFLMDMNETLSNEAMIQRVEQEASVVKTLQKTLDKLKPSKDGKSMTFTTWVIVQDFGSSAYLNKEKSILVWPGSFKILLSGEQKNNLIISASMKKSNGKGGGIKTTTIQNYPLRRWFHISVVFRPNSLEIYIDGELSRTLSFEYAFAGRSSDDLSYGGYGGTISNVRYFNKALTYKDIKSIYVKGPMPLRITDIKSWFQKSLPTVDGDFRIGQFSVKKFFKDDVFNPIKGWGDALMGVDSEGVTSAEVIETV